MPRDRILQPTPPTFVLLRKAFDEGPPLYCIPLLGKTIPPRPGMAADGTPILKFATRLTTTEWSLVVAAADEEAARAIINEDLSDSIPDSESA